MAEYIDREKIAAEARALSTHLLNEWDTIGVLALIDRQPAADVAEVRHGKWVWNGETCCNQCSVCGVGAMWFRVQMEYYYCPNCGAKMDESEDKDNG